MTAPRGFVLVNALVLVAAIAAAAVLLLARADDGRQRLSSGLAAERLSLMLDARETLARQRLATGSPEDAATVPLDGGQVSARAENPQSGFNVNWLFGSGSDAPRAAFARLVAAQGLAPQLTDAVAKALDDGGPVLTLDQLESRMGAGLPDRLRPLLDALPPGVRLDLNAAPEPVIAALLPDLPAAIRARLLARRQGSPFASVAGFVAAAGQSLDRGLLTTDASWRRVTITARLGDRVAVRTSMLHRESNGRVAVAWRIAGPVR